MTADLDRFIDFYTSVFEAVVFADLTEAPVRHAASCGVDLSNVEPATGR